MILTVPQAFQRFYEAVNLPGEHRAAANVRKDWIVARLGRSMSVLGAHAIGSIPRYTALAGHADLDVLVVLHHGMHIKDRSPAQVLAAAKSALGAGAGAYRRNGQAVTIRFNSWPDVDVVPAARVLSGAVFSHYKIPDMNRGAWIKTDPQQHARKINAAAAMHGGGFRRTITMIKHWNRRQDVRLQSYHVEVIALGVDGDWDDPAWAVYRWFRASKTRTRFCWDGADDASAYLTWERAGRAAGRLAECESVALQAWRHADRGDHREAIRLLRTIFGNEFPAYG